MIITYLLTIDGGFYFGQSDGYEKFYANSIYEGAITSIILIKKVARYGSYRNFNHQLQRSDPLSSKSPVWSFWKEWFNDYWYLKNKNN